MYVMSRGIFRAPTPFRTHPPPNRLALRLGFCAVWCGRSPLALVSPCSRVAVRRGRPSLPSPPRGRPLPSFPVPLALLAAGGACPLLGRGGRGFPGVRLRLARRALLPRAPPFPRLPPHPAAHSLAVALPRLRRLCVSLSARPLRSDSSRLRRERKPHRFSGCQG